MKPTTTVTTGTFARWTVQVGFALLVVATLVASTLAGVGAADIESQVELEEFMCLNSGGRWIEMVDKQGNITGVSCAYDDGTIINCSPLATICRTELSSPSSPTKPAGELGPGAVPEQELAPIDEPPAKSGSEGEVSPAKPLELKR